MSDFYSRGSIQQELIKRGVLNLKEFGYPFVNVDNILTDEIYSAFFLSMLKDNIGLGFDYEIRGLIDTIEKGNKNA